MWYLWTPRGDPNYIKEMTVEEAEVLWNNHKHSTRSIPYPTLDALIAGERVTGKPCLKCGGVVKTHWIEPTMTRLRETNTCFHCDHWVELMKVKSRSIRVKGGHYMLGTQTANVNPSFRGFSGRHWKIRFNDGHEVETVDLWFQGDIPARFAADLPDNAVFVNEKGETI